jgi:hypothetical protein
MKKILITLAMAALGAVSAQAGVLLNPHSKCTYHTTRYGPETTVYSGDTYTSIVVESEDHQYGFVIFSVIGNYTLYATDFANLTETEN